MKSYDEYCGLALALDCVGERWTLLIVRELLTGPKRFVDLANGLPGIASNLLTSRLKSMEESGLVAHRRLPPPAAASVYTLTESGEELAEPIFALVRWGGRFMKRRARGLAFRPHWLGVALEALLHGARLPAAPLLAHIRTPEGVALLQFGPARVGFVPDSPRAPAVDVRAPAQLLLGVAAGEVSWSTAIESGMRVDGTPESVEAFRSVFSGIANPPTP